MVLKGNPKKRLASIAQEVGAQVILGHVRYPGREGGSSIGDVHHFFLGEPLLASRTDRRHLCPPESHRIGGIMRPIRLDVARIICYLGHNRSQDSPSIMSQRTGQSWFTVQIGTVP